MKRIVSFFAVIFSIFIFSSVASANFMERVTMIHSEKELIEAIPEVEVIATENGIKFLFDRTLFPDTKVRVAYYSGSENEEADDPKLVICNAEGPDTEAYEIIIPGPWYQKRPFFIEFFYDLNWGFDYREKNMLPIGGYTMLIQSLLVSASESIVKEEFLLSNANDDSYGIINIGFSRDRIHWHSMRYQYQDDTFEFRIKENDPYSVKEMTISGEPTADEYYIGLGRAIAGMHPLRFAAPEANPEYPTKLASIDGEIRTVRILPESSYWNDRDAIEAERTVLERDGDSFETSINYYSGIAKGYGGDVTVSLSIRSDDIFNLKIDAADETPEYLEKVKNKLAMLILFENRVDVDSDITSGATVTSQAILQAAASALEQRLN